MYYEYWGLTKPAFDNVPDPSMYVDCHASMESAIAETIFAVEEGDECVAVIVGDVGLGKTMSIRMIIDSLNQEKYKIALITNPGISFVQILQEIIGQLTGRQCEEKRKVNLLEIFNALLFTTLDEGKKILIFIDEANAITPVNLESLRLLTNMQSDKKNLFTMVLAGQIEFAKRLEHPKRANLFQRVGTYSRIDKLESAEVVKKYIETRIRLAGGTRQVFAGDAFQKLWEYSDHGVPRLINKLAKLCLKAGETNHFASIGGDVVEQIGSRFLKLTGPNIQQRRSRKRIREALPTDVEESLDEGTAYGDADEAACVKSGEEEKGATLPEPLSADVERENNPLVLSVEPEQAIQEQAEIERTAQDQAGTEAVMAAAEEKPPEVSPECEPEEVEKRPGSAEELRIGDFMIKINFPEHLIRQSVSSTREYRFKLAGALAAETLRVNPQLIASHKADPVPIWQEIRDFVLNKMDTVSSLQPY